MLVEALHYTRARLGGESNAYGHLTELVGIWARQRRQRPAWAGHLARARALCLAAAESTFRETRRTALVYGAGILNDIPLERLSSLFRRVVLADMAFLPRTVHLAKALGNVELMRTDLTGVLHAPPPSEFLAARAPAPMPDLRLGLKDVDFAYSANVLSQLPLAALATLGERTPAPDPQHLKAYAASLVRAHLAALKILPCPACLVTDFQEQGLAGGQTHYDDNLLFGVDPALPGETWTWRLAPRGEAHPELDIERHVLGAPDVHAGPDHEIPHGDRNA
ncbi:MAG: hypothetical protein P4L39_01025 [Humidesulfovibrio sp.]|nr:hypothetical protein [Humidesulfovibrio sp.]